MCVYILCVRFKNINGSARSNKLIQQIKRWLEWWPEDTHTMDDQGDPPAGEDTTRQPPPYENQASE